MLKEVIMQGLIWTGGHMRLFSSHLDPPLRGVFPTMTSDMLVGERSGEGLNHLTRDMKGQGSRLHDQQYARAGR